MGLVDKFVHGGKNIFSSYKRIELTRQLFKCVVFILFDKCISLESVNVSSSWPWLENISRSLVRVELAVVNWVPYIHIEESTDMTGWFPVFSQTPCMVNNDGKTHYLYGIVTVRHP